MAVTPTELEPGLWRWSSVGQHHDDADPRRVSHHHAFASGDALVIVDPVGFSGSTPALDALLDQAITGRALHVVLTDPLSTWHTGERLCRERGGTIWGSARTAALLGDPTLLQELTPGETGPGGIVAHHVGGPTSDDRAIWVPSHDTLVFGAAVIRDPAEGPLHVPGGAAVDPRTAAWYRDAVHPAYERLLDVPMRRIALRHGESVTVDPAGMLLDALTRGGARPG